MSTSPPPASDKNEFEAAKTVSETIRPFGKEKQELILRMVSEVMGLKLPTTPPTPPPAPPPDNPPSPAVTQGIQTPASTLDIKSFVNQKLPKSDQQYAAVIAYYYRFVAPEGQRSETINAVSLQDSTRLTDHKRFPRPDVTLNNAFGQGYLDRVSRGEFRINTVGENLVAMTLPGSVNGGTKPKQKGKKSKPKATPKTKSTTKARKS